MPARNPKSSPLTSLQTVQLPAAHLPHNFEILIPRFKKDDEDEVQTQQTTASLADLPVELHLNIISQCRTIDAQMLRMTNRHFHSIIPTDTPFANGARSEPLVVEKMPWAKELGLLYCFFCNNLRKRAKSTVQMQQIREKKKLRPSQKPKRRYGEENLYWVSKSAADD